MVVNGHSKPELYLENSSNNHEVSILGVESLPLVLRVDFLELLETEQFYLILAK
jgi:hypothetical protein